jgi:hypothetical protein
MKTFENEIPGRLLAVRFDEGKTRKNRMAGCASLKGKALDAAF